jgi:hypothetical protein
MLHATNRRRKLFILSLKLNTGLAISQQRKEESMYSHFVNLLGQTQSCSASLNWAHLRYEWHDLLELEDPFEEDGNKKIIMHLPNEKKHLAPMAS